MSLIFKIKKAETPFYARIKSLLMSMYRMELPYIIPLYKLLYLIRLFCYNFFGWAKSRLWDVPVFKSICKEAGKGLLLPHGIPKIQGNPVMYVGNNVTLHRLQIEAQEGSYNPILKIGDNVIIGTDTNIRLCNEIDIGTHCLIGVNNQIMDYNCYEEDEDSKDKNYVVIEENVWTGRNVTIQKGVRIGKDSIISSNSLVLNDIPENVIAMGIPARIIVKNVDKFYKDC